MNMLDTLAGPAVVFDTPAGYARALAARAGLSVISIGQWPDRPGPAPAGPRPVAAEPPPVAGFVESSFSPMVVEVASRCLRAVRPPTTAGAAETAGSSQQAAEPDPSGRVRTAVVIVSESGDVATATVVANAVDRDERVGPLLFFAAVPNAVAGYVAARWGLTGPVVCLSPDEDALAQGLAAARLVIRDGDADEALVVHVEQGGAGHETDSAVAILVRPAVTAPANRRTQEPSHDAGGDRP
jgi:hypothetical protein